MFLIRPKKEFIICHRNVLIQHFLTLTFFCVWRNVEHWSFSAKDLEYLHF